MSLVIAITHNTGSPSYVLKAEKVSHNFSKLATVAPLVAAGPDEEPVVFSLDLGMILEQITISGYVDATGNPSLMLPSKSQLETVCRNWWNYTNAAAADPGVLPIVTIDTGEHYFFVLKQADFVKQGAMEDRWEFSLVLLVTGKYIP